MRNFVEQKFVMDVTGVGRKELAIILRDIALQLESTRKRAKLIVDEYNCRIGEWELIPFGWPPPSDPI